MSILVDTNVVLDVLQHREPFYKDSYNALRIAFENDIECLISASAVTDIFYVLRKQLGSANDAKAKIELLCNLLSIADVQGVDIQDAMTKPMSDFEDAVVDAVAQRYSAEYILTRNTKDFIGSSIPAILPCEFLDVRQHGM